MKKFKRTPELQARNEFFAKRGAVDAVVAFMAEDGRETYGASDIKPAMLYSHGFGGFDDGLHSVRRTVIPALEKGIREGYIFKQDKEKQYGLTDAGKQHYENSIKPALGSLAIVEPPRSLSELQRRYGSSPPPSALERAPEGLYANQKEKLIIWAILEQGPLAKIALSKTVRARSGGKYKIPEIEQSINALWKREVLTGGSAAGGGTRFYLSPETRRLLTNEEASTDLTERDPQERQGRIR